MDKTVNMLKRTPTKTDELIEQIVPAVKKAALGWSERIVAAQLNGAKPEALAVFARQRDDALRLAAFQATKPIRDHALAERARIEKEYEARNSVVDEAVRDRISSMTPSDLQRAIKSASFDPTGAGADQAMLAALGAEARRRGMTAEADAAGLSIATPAYHGDEAWQQAQHDVDMVERWAAKTNNEQRTERVSVFSFLPTTIGDIVAEADQETHAEVQAFRAATVVRHHLDAEPYDHEVSLGIVGRD